MFSLDNIFTIKKNRNTFGMLTKKSPKPNFFGQNLKSFKLLKKCKKNWPAIKNLKTTDRIVWYKELR